jgi:hypothetical protein
MPFEANNTHGKGRPKGSTNKKTQATREIFEALVHDNLDQLQNDLQAMTPRWRVHYILEMAKFVLPTLKAVEHSADPEDGFQIVTFEFSE